MGDVSARIKRLLEAKATRTADSFHRELGRLMWDHCGMSRSAAGLKLAIGSGATITTSQITSFTGGEFWAYNESPDLSALSGANVPPVMPAPMLRPTGPSTMTWPPVMYSQQ